jgi:hypothetical protein
LKFLKTLKFSTLNHFRKIALFLFAAVFSSASAQGNITLNCTFSVNWITDYVCRLTDIEVLDPSQQIIFTGEHVGNRTNEDVTVVEIRNSNTPFMIPQIFTTFPSIIELDIQFSNLQSINIPDSVQLESLILSHNNISRINNGTFRAQNRLRVFNAIEAGIHVIEDDAFVGLESLTALVFIRNNVSELTTRTLAPLVNALRIDFERNQLTRIDNIFSMNTNLTYVYLEFNQITEISPLLARNLVNTTGSINLRGNQCIDRYFTFEDELELILFNNAARGCFDNFQEVRSETRRITLEFQGPIALFDEFGNIIARVN